MSFGDGATQRALQAAVAASLFGRKVVAHRLGLPRRRRQVGEHPAAVRDLDLKLVALKENPILVSAR
jgi:hypothetical protein